MSSYMEKLIASESLLWDEAVNHRFILDMCEDTLPLSRFRDYTIQIRAVCGHNLRDLLARLLTRCEIDQLVQQAICKFILYILPGGEHHDGLAETMRCAGVPPDAHAHLLPPTESLIDYMHTVGEHGSLRQAVVMVTTLVEVTCARFARAKESSRLPSNPVFAMWFTHHAAPLVHALMHWTNAMMNSFFDHSQEVIAEERAVMKRTLQWFILMTDSARNRGFIEWPGEKHYHHVASFTD